MIIDCHTHIFPAKIRTDRDLFCRQDEGFSSIYRDEKAKMVGVEDLIVSMDESHVDRSVICGFPWGPPDLCALHNDYLLESFSRFPDRLIVFVCLPVKHPDWSMRELERGIENGAKGVGEVAFYHEALTSGDIEAMKPWLSFMERRKFPLLLHTNETLGHAYPGKGKTPLDRFYELILTFPTLPVLLAHWGGGLPFYELMPEVARSMAHVYYDTAASPFLYSKRIYAILSDIVGPEKILFGSDFPLISPKRYFREMKESGLTEEVQRKILGLNLSRLLQQGGEKK